MNDFPYGAPLARGPMGGDAFTQIHNGVFRDPNLSYRAKGIFGFLSTHVEGWKVSEAAIAKAAREGRDAVRAGLRELEAQHYLIRSRERTARGTLGSSVWFFTDLPAQIAALGVTDPDLIASKVREAFEAWQSCWSAPVTDNPSQVTTSGHTASGGLGLVERLRRSVPMTGFPTLGNPDLANPAVVNPTTKNNKNQKIKNQKIKADSQGGEAVSVAAVIEGSAVCLSGEISGENTTTAMDSSGARLLRRLSLPFPVTVQILKQNHEKVTELLQTWPESVLVRHLEAASGRPGLDNPQGVLVATINGTLPRNVCPHEGAPRVQAQPVLPHKATPDNLAELAGNNAFLPSRLRVGHVKHENNIQED